MLRFDPKAFAREIKDLRPELKRLTVQVADDDGRLVIRVNEEGGSTIGYHDTGLDGDDDPTEAEQLADELVEALNAGRRATRVEAKRYDFDLEPDNQWK